MTEDKERNKAIERLTLSTYYDAKRRWAFRSGVEWADTHPRSNWISVGEELPQDDEFVLTVNTVNVQEVCRRYEGKWYTNHNEEAQGPITHWQNLPSVPDRKEIYE